MTTTTTDAPTSAAIWLALRALFGTRMLGASLTVLTHHGEYDVVTTYVFPKDLPNAMGGEAP